MYHSGAVREQKFRGYIISILYFIDLTAGRIGMNGHDSVKITPKKHGK